MSGVVELVDLRKTFNDVTAVENINLRIEDGEFFSLLGPSGCGKTTTLRLIAGFERPDSGAILIDGVDQAATPPHRRPVNTVFQSYALFPHMNVADNVGFGLRYRDVPKADYARLVGAALEKVRLDGMESRKPTQLSGGQQQRVALARSLVLNPSVLLLDEPLGALDAKLRKALQVELKGLQSDLGMTFIYVTHDQEEALTMSDRIAVMSSGRVEQLGTPAEVYETPTSSYVAEFLGVSNMMEVVVTECRPDETVLDLSGHRMTASTPFATTGQALVSIRPERIQIVGADEEMENVVPAVVERTVYAGPVISILVRIEEGAETQVVLPNEGRAKAYPHGEVVMLRFPREAIRVLATADQAV